MERRHRPTAETSRAVRLLGDLRRGTNANWRARLTAVVCAISALLPVFPPPGDAATNQELVPGSRLVFPYYDLRPGFLTFLFFTNVSRHLSASVQLEFYDVSCARRDSGLDLTPTDVDLLDLGSVLGRDPSGAFQQGFVDAFTSDGDFLLGMAFIVNAVADVAIAYPAAPARRVSGGTLPFEPYPTRLFLPAFVTPGQLGQSTTTDGLLILAAPHPTTPGAALPEQPIQASVSLIFKGGRADSGGLAGHQVIVPIGQLVGTSRPPTLGWLGLTNSALDESGNPIGLVGLYLQTVAGPGVGMAMAIRLSSDPGSQPTP
jgi:hypothetical protein